jgi:hypothetical protein
MKQDFVEESKNEPIKEFKGKEEGTLNNKKLII